MMKIKLLTLLCLLSIQLSFAVTPTDITASYLQNYKRPFSSIKDTLIKGTKYFKPASPWITEGNKGTMGIDYTSWFVDGSFSNFLTLKAAQNGFQGGLNNIKIYQTITLPAGSYEISVFVGLYKTAASRTFLAVTQGTGISDIDNLSSSIGYTRLDQYNKVSFVLNQETQISIGLVSSPYDGDMIIINNFKLLMFSGTNYDKINDLIANYSALTNYHFPTGTIIGTYSQEKWDIFQTALSNAQYYANNNPDDTQENVDTQSQSLLNTYNELVNSLIKPIVSNSSNTVWYMLKLNNKDNVYLTAGTNGAYVKAGSLIPNDSQLWKFIQNPNTSDNGLAIVNKATGEYLNADVAINSQVNTSPTLPFNNISIQSNGYSTNGVCPLIIVNSDNSNSRFSLISRNKIILNSLSEDELSATEDWTILAYEEQLKLIYQMLFNNSVELYNKTFEGNDYGQYPTTARNIFENGILEINSKDINTMTDNEIKSNIDNLRSYMDNYIASRINDISTIVSTVNAPKWYNIINNNSSSIFYKMLMSEHNTAINCIDKNNLPEQLWRFESNPTDNTVKIISTSNYELKILDDNTTVSLINENSGTYFTLSSSFDNYSTNFRYNNSNENNYLGVNNGSGNIVGNNSINSLDINWIFQYVETNTGINFPFSSPTIKAYQKQGKIYLTGTSEPFRIFDIAGMEVNTNNVQKSGVYLVRVGSKTTKIIIP